MDFNIFPLHKIPLIFTEILLFNAEERRDVESYKLLVELFKMIHIDNMRVLKALICPRDDVLALVDGTTKKRVGSSNTYHYHYCCTIIDITISTTNILRVCARTHTHIYTHTHLVLVLIFML